MIMYVKYVTRLQNTGLLITLVFVKSDVLEVKLGLTGPTVSELVAVVTEADMIRHYKRKLIAYWTAVSVNMGDHFA